MHTYSIEELDREEIEFLPSRVVMTLCNTRCAPPPCYVPRCEPMWCPPPTCKPTIELYVSVRLGLGGLL